MRTLRLRIRDCGLRIDERKEDERQASFHLPSIRFFFQSAIRNPHSEIEVFRNPQSEI
jgi:hypothetical protein